MTFECPSSLTFSVSRECSDEGVWLQFDQSGCGFLAGELTDLLDLQVSEKLNFGRTHVLYL